MNGRLALGASDWLALAAAPTFALMALLSAVGGGGLGPICSQVGQPWLLDGMTPMYLLMAAFHLVPWFRLAAKSRG